MKTTTQETVAQRALRLLEPIPADKFITHAFTDTHSCCCAIGHYMRLTSDDPTDYRGSNCNDRTYGNSRITNIQGSDLRRMSTAFLEKKYGITDHTISEVNNTDKINGYTQPGIKDRVIACLREAVEAGF